MTASWSPVVTVVVPMLNEAEYIDDCLDSFAEQTYPHDLLDVVVVDGGSTDGSRSIVDQRAQRESWLRVIDNPQRRASTAFNRGTEAAKGEVVCLFSAHGVASATFVERSVAVLHETEASGVGGRYDHVGVDPASSAIGLAMVSPFGMASPHRFATSRREVDTISHPAYRREAMVDTGPFDESLLRNSDYEFNHRMRALGHALLFDPSIVSVYRPRPSLTALARQFWWYGRWKARVIRQHPSSLRPRHLVPPLAVLGVMAAPAIARWGVGRRVLALAMLGYAAIVGVGVRRARPREHDADPAVLAASFPVMHFSWGAGVVASAVEDVCETLRP